MNDADPQPDRYGSATLTTDPETLAALVADGDAHPDALELRTAAGRVRIDASGSELRVQAIDGGGSDE